ncbi:hypothetical protein [Hymenobacter lucidus]|uniref:Uncharacterized protein n=1 Tax=Hymenobacter lucidus TaxID=2880930 RepID=A0ABS8AQH3_9BACT|nr:hypothetical protein [Hymenobacter lucidus]MCB2407649.1 hypothetical protein [Hymenobacter lucidus]
MSAPVSSNADFLLSKSEAELLYLVQNPTYYHSELVNAARKELHRRGVTISYPVAANPAQLPLVDTAYDEEAPTRHWLAPAIGVGLVVVAAGFFLWPSGAKKPAQAVAPAKPAELVSVATHQMPSFDSLTTAQLKKMPATLPAAERADTAAQRKFLLLARRFWEAENPSNYLFDQVVADQLDATFPGQADMTLDKWHRLTSVLVYDHRLRPTMSRQLQQMSRVAITRINTLEAQRDAYKVGAAVLTEYSMLMNDSILYMRQGLLGVPVGQRIKPGTVTKARQPKAAPAVAQQLQLPPTRPGHNPLYVLDGELLASDPQTGDAPEKVARLHPDSIARVLVVNGKAAVAAFGPRAHSGAVVVTTKRAAAASRE